MFSPEQLERIRLDMSGPLIGTRHTADEYLHGMCGMFAIALADRFKYSLYAICDHREDGDKANDQPLHFFAVDSSNRYIDVRGIMTDKKQLYDPFEDFIHGEPFVASSGNQEIRNIINNNPNMTYDKFTAWYTAAQELIIQYPVNYYLPPEVT